MNQTIIFNYNANEQPYLITTTTTGGTKNIEIEYNETNEYETIKDPEGNDITLENNNNGKVIQVTYYEGSKESIQPKNMKTLYYDPNGLLTATSDSITGQTTDLTHHKNGHLVCFTNEYGCEECYWIEYPETNEISVSRSTKAFPKNSCDSFGYNPVLLKWVNSDGHETEYEYDDSGLLIKSTDYLDRETNFSYDGFGRLLTKTLPDGKQKTYSYNSNSQVTSANIEGEGQFSYAYDNSGRLSTLVDPTQGSFTYAYNVRGDMLSETLSSQTTNYSYDLLGRVTQVSYPNSGSKSITYTPDGYISSFDSESFIYDENGNVINWEDGSNEVEYLYSSPGSEQLGLPSSVAGSGDIGDYSFSYNSTYWLHELTDTSKVNQQYEFVYSSSKELTYLSYPNTLQLHQTWTSKRLDLITVTDYLQQNTYLSSDATYNSNEQMTDYDYLVNAGQNSFSESYSVSYDSLGRVSSINTESSNKTLSYGYDSSNGKLSSLQFSDLGTYSVDYLTNGNIDSVAYPNNQGEETYSYNGGKGRISQISYPNNDTIAFQWNDLDEITQLTYYEDNTQTTTQYIMTYTTKHQLKSITQSIDSIQQYIWNLSWAPNGLEKAVKKVNSQTVLTQDFSTDPYGRILSMTYNTPGEGYDGELYFHYDHFGNTSLITDSNANPIASFQYDLYNNSQIGEWNPNDLVIINTVNGIHGNLTVEKPGDGQISFNGGFLGIIAINPVMVETKYVVGGIPKHLQYYSPCDPEEDLFEDEEGEFAMMGTNVKKQSKFKNREDCLKYCNDEFAESLGDTNYQIVVLYAATLIALLILYFAVAIFFPAATILTSFIIPKLIQTVTQGAVSLISGIFLSFVWHYFDKLSPCRNYCNKNYKS